MPVFCCGADALVRAGPPWPRARGPALQKASQAAKPCGFARSQNSGMNPNSKELASQRRGRYNVAPMDKAAGRLIPFGARLSRNVWVFIRALVVLYVLLTATPLARYYSAPLYVKSDATASDVIILLSSSQIDSDWLTPDASQRTLGALKLYREHYASHIISSGSQFANGLHQAELQAEWLERAGVPPEAILVEGRSHRTYQSAEMVSRIMAQHGWTSAVIVTSQMDVPRVKLAFRKWGVRTSFLATPEFRTQTGFHVFDRWASDVSYHATYEYAALVLYKLKGWI